MYTGLGCLDWAMHGEFFFLVENEGRECGGLTCSAACAGVDGFIPLVSAGH